MKSLTRNLATRNTITGTNIQITAETDIPKRLCIPAMGIWIWQFPVTVMVKPQFIKKYQNTVTQNIEERLLSMYAKGMITSDIESHMKELYDMDISASTSNQITDKILPIVKE